MKKLIFNRFILLISLFFLLVFPFYVNAATESASAWQSWSGYWWPYRYGGLATGIDYKGQPAPLQKYEMLYNASYMGQTITEYKNQHYNPDALHWEGLCHAYAAAAVTENLDFRPCVIDNILFRTGDKKGLISMSHDNDWIYGIRQGCETPDVFHMWLLTYIKDQGKSFVADLEPTAEVWNYPVYRYKMDISETTSEIKVKCTIWYANDLIPPDYSGTDERNESYEYRLFKTGDEITGGEWLGTSITNHPKMLVMPLATKSTLSSLDYQKTKSIASKVDDELESDLPVSILPGFYRLLLLNEDQYIINVDQEETGKLCINKEEGSQNINFEILNSQGSVIESGTLNDSRCYTLPGAGAPYTVKLKQDDYSNLGLYTVQFDTDRVYEFNCQRTHGGTYWGGFAVVNRSADIVSNICVTGYKANGDPLQTYLGPFSLNPGQKKIIMMSDFRQRNIDRQDLSGIKIMSSAKVDVTYMAGNSLRNLLSFQNPTASQALVLPDTMNWFNSIKNLTWGLYNPESGSANISIRLFQKTGSLKSTSTLALASKEMANYSEGSQMPYNQSADDGWALVESDLPVSGYEQWIDRGGIKAEQMPLLKPGKNFVIPHVVSDGFWKMKTTMINVSSMPINVNIALVNGGISETAVIGLAPYEKKALDIRSLFISNDDAYSSSLISVQADGNMAGYFTYETANDYISFPLLDENSCKTELLMPHSAAKDEWWTGVTICNMNDVSATVQISGYGINGEPAGSPGLVHVLSPYSKKVFSVSDLFGADSPSVEYIKINSDRNIYGLFGMGNTSANRITGGVLE